MNFFRKLVLSLMAATLPVVAMSVEPKLLSKTDKQAMEQWVSAKFNAMTPDERITQLFVMAVAPRAEGVEAVVKKLVAEYKIGGLIYHEADIMSQAKLTNYAQSIATVPLLITLDAEWGPSMRLEDAPKFPRNLYLGAVGDDKLFYEYGREVARQCRRVGVHVNFAPVLDVIDREHTILGTRSYGSDPDLVARHGIAFSRGMEDGGVLSVGKHFPGHGSTIADSHKELPTVDKNLRELELFDFVPFRRFIDAGLGGMLTAHLYVPAVDKTKGPSTMSAKHVTDLLQKKMGFEGLIFTDALGMEGAKATNGSVCVNALLAGNDVLLMPSEVPGELAAIKQAIDEGRLSQSVIDERCKKILRYKYALGLNNTQQVNLSNIVSDVNAASATVLKRKLCAASITVVRNNKSLLPLRNLESRRIAVVTIGNENGVKSMFQRRCANYAETAAYDLSEGQSAVEVCDEIKKHQHNCVIISLVQPTESQIKTAKYIASHCKNVIVAVMSSPERLNEVGGLLADSYVSAALLAYESTSVAEDYLAQTIFGGNDATGVLPVNVATGKHNELKAGTGFHFKAERLGYTIPAEVGFKSNLLAKIDSVCNYGVNQRAFPGCQVVVARHGKIVCNRAYGEIDFNSGIPVTVNTLFDLASVSKASGTISCVMKLFDEGKFGLNDKASDFIDGLKGGDKEDITFRDLLYHETGMPPSLSMWEMMFDTTTYVRPLITTAPNENNTIKIMNNAYGNKFARLRTDILSYKRTDVFDVPIAKGIWGSAATYDSIMNRIYHVTLGPKKYLYSCLNFCLLANVVQNVTKLPLNYYANNQIFAPLGAYHTLYRPLSKFPEEQIAYTENDTFLRSQHIHGYVHDELAAFSGGVQGNASLFSSANDLAKLFQMWLNGGTYGGHRFYKASTVETFTTQKSPNSHRGLGFDKPIIGNPEASSTCREATAETYGHTGFTGTCFWVDPKNDMIYIFLSNRVSPTRNNSAFSRVSARSHIQSILYKSIIK